MDCAKIIMLSMFKYAYLINLCILPSHFLKLRKDPESWLKTFRAKYKIFMPLHTVIRPREFKIAHIIGLLPS